MSASESSKAEPARPPNGRPAQIASLVLDDRLTDPWFLANMKQTRFFVLNLEVVLAKIALEHTTAKPYFEAAKDAIADETDWANQYGFDYQSSHTQIYPDKRWQPKLFGRAATIIVAMELAAKKNKPELNVYDHLRILPATSFIDGFDDTRLNALDEHYRKLDAAEREARFGAAAASLPFEAAVRQHIEQPYSKRLMNQLTAGFTATKWVCDQIRDYVNPRVPAELKLGATRTVGDDNLASPKLGTKRAADDLKVPRRRDEAELPPCF